MIDVFVSYAPEDDTWVRRLASNLSQRGLRVFFDVWDVLPGDVIVHRVDAAISDAACAIAVFSQASAASPKALEEYAALATAGATRNLRFIPLLIDEATLPPFAANRVWRDFRNVGEQEYEEKIEELCTVILGDTAGGTAKSSDTQLREENLASALPSPARVITEPDQCAFVICYAPADAAYGLELAGQLRTAGLSVWSAADLRPGDSQFWTIRQQLAFATAVIVLMSPHSQDSDDITRMILEATLHQRPFFPILLEGKRNYHLAHTWYVDARDGRLLNPAEIDLLRELDATRRAGRPAAPSPVLPAPLTRPTVGTVRVPPDVSLERLDSYLAEGELAHADLHTTAVVLEAANRLDEGWAGARHVHGIPASVLAGIDAIWADHTHGRQGFRAQAELSSVRRARHSDFLALSVACGWRGSADGAVPQSYREFTNLAGPGPRNGFYPSLRNPQNELFLDWYDQWAATVLAVHLHAGKRVAGE
ncbi:toll/interleukin-1 receptor domain-containing protein [Streptomyces sudanensis]|uniref:toll/interleukin-1 receptor domain-containing protein n=1 Tax=Streptomyces sudanensis TaxID=436397 RepID=UPI0020CE3971|nr:toll/interleukin-1 receptor domain-containing protein [Streptomyces sudanensis]MCP9958012.1 toll/interleukin-1 receptor domain-containing protein [Streptomyces sudanensis]MCQ0001460.1 toll/interleukin-1 receptor domain-containing protein [Streptomyces sudanensis]